MGFQIVVNTGEMGDVILRGCSDGTVEMCQWKEWEKLDKETKVKTPVKELVAFKYYANPEQAFQKVARMRVGSTMASSIQELVEAIRSVRADIKKEMGGL